MAQVHVDIRFDLTNLNKATKKFNDFYFGGPPSTPGMREVVEPILAAEGYEVGETPQQRRAHDIRVASLKRNRQLVFGTPEQREHLRQQAAEIQRIYLR